MRPSTPLPGRFVYSIEGGGLWVMDGDGSHRRQITRPPKDKVDFDPSLSRSGREVVFRTTRPDPFPDPQGLGLDGISVVDTADLRIRAIQPSTGGLFPAWSPSGDVIAFSGVRADGAESIFLMRPDGTHLRDLGASGECADWSPDARKIAFCHQTHGVNGWDVWVMNADGSDQHPLVASGGNDYPGPWSPDAKELSFGSIRTGIVQTYVIRADGSRLRQLTHGADPAAPFIWLDDGRIIVAVSKPGSNPDSSPPPDWYALDVGEGHMVALPQLHGAVELDWQAS